MKSIQICLNEGQLLFGRENNIRITDFINKIKNKIPELQNHLANFNQTWYKAYWVSEVCSNKGQCLFARGDNNELVNIL